MFVCAISRLRSLNNAVTMVYPRSISRLRRNQNQISRATSPTFTTLLLMGFNNRINRPVDGRLLNQLKTHLVQPSKTYATTIRPTDLPFTFGPPLWNCTECSYLTQLLPISEIESTGSTVDLLGKNPPPESGRIDTICSDH